LWKKEKGSQGEGREKRYLLWGRFDGAGARPKSREEFLVGRVEKGEEIKEGKLGKK